MFDNIKSVHFAARLPGRWRGWTVAGLYKLISSLGHFLVMEAQTLWKLKHCFKVLFNSKSQSLHALLSCAYVLQLLSAVIRVWTVTLLHSFHSNTLAAACLWTLIFWRMARSYNLFCCCLLWISWHGTLIKSIYDWSFAGWYTIFTIHYGVYRFLFLFLFVGGSLFRSAYFITG